ncbi:hypothetical protein BaRGS_00010801 [Batillaria attramentaria]|uniref:Uncharacterized protein n=1 Tax=Batillaria attramentaria TaxID=370345 RepID=A0ABD0LEN5_9CAEN
MNVKGDNNGRGTESCFLASVPVPVYSAAAQRNTDNNIKKKTLAALVTISQGTAAGVYVKKHLLAINCMLMA